MSKVLSNIVMRVVESDSANNTPGDIYEAARALEGKIIEEICNEQADKILRKQRELRAAEVASERVKDIRNIALQCVVIALLVGMICNHAYTLFQSIFYNLPTNQILTNTTIGLLLLALILLVLLIVLLIKALNDLYKTFKSKD